MRRRDAGEHPRALPERQYMETYGNVLQRTCTLRHTMAPPGTVRRPRGILRHPRHPPAPHGTLWDLTAVNSTLQQPTVPNIPLRHTTASYGNQRQLTALFSNLQYSTTWQLVAFNDASVGFSKGCLRTSPPKAFLAVCCGIAAVVSPNRVTCGLWCRCLVAHD